MKDYKQFDNLFLEKLSMVPKGFIYNHYGLSEACKKFVEKIQKQNPEIIFNAMKHYDIKLCVKNHGEDLYFQDLSYTDIVLDKDYVKFEAALTLVIAVMLNRYACYIGVTKSAVDGGFDIAIRSADKNTLLIIDAKSGTHTTDKHVEWTSLKSENKYLYKVVQYANNNLGHISNEKSREKHVYNLSLDTFLCNLTALVLRDLNNIHEIRMFRRDTVTMLNNINKVESIVKDANEN